MQNKRYRLSGYDYSTARAYMVTLKMHPQAAPLSVLAPTTKLGITYTSLTAPFTEVITKRLVAYFRGGVSVRRFILMPNHIHILFYLNKCSDKRATNLIIVAEKCITFLTEAYHQIHGPTSFRPINTSWDDSIAFTPEAARRMRKYIDDNPFRTHLRQHSDFCKCRTYHAKDGRQWWYYGNLSLVKLPTILAVECSRKILPDTPLWETWLETASTLSTTGAGIGTFMSPCEKAVQNTILQNGGSLIILLPQGISSYWHPSAEMETLCTQGRILYLTPFAFEAAQPPASVLYQRCHAGGGLKELMSQLACNIISPPRE
jgi:hypothetical protein